MCDDAEWRHRHQPTTKGGKNINKDAGRALPTTGADGDRKLTFIDLFSGCGGFSLGLEWAGLTCKAAVDFNEPAIETFRRNHPHVPHVLVRDLTRFGPKDLDKLLGSDRVDVVVGGPPCQGFSRARQVDGANHGGRLVHDARRDLYKEFLRFVKYYQPRVFVMENVPGMKSAAGGEFFTRVQVESRELGYRVIPYEVEAWRFGVPQKRVRQLIIGTRRELAAAPPLAGSAHWQSGPKETSGPTGLRVPASEARHLCRWMLLARVLGERLAVPS